MASKNNTKKRNPALENLNEGIHLYKSHDLFGYVDAYIYRYTKKELGTDCAATVDAHGYVNVNVDYLQTPKQWLYTIAHCQLHLAFGHFDADKVPGYEITDKKGIRKKVPSFDKRVWNQACDLYIAKFLADIKLGEAISLQSYFPVNLSLSDERKIYEYLLEDPNLVNGNPFGTAAHEMDMDGLEHPLEYIDGNSNKHSKNFAYALAYSVSSAVSVAGGHEVDDTPTSNASQAAKWFLDHFPLLGGIASSFKLIEDYRFCAQHEIQIAAIDVTEGEIYINPAMNFSKDEWRFVLAHEYLHAGLGHKNRREGRDPYLWNVACDFVINSWLKEMQIGIMPSDGLLFDESLTGLSAESIYDTILSDMRKYKKVATFRGYGQGDLLGDGPSGFHKNRAATSLDEFCRSALQQGLEFHIEKGRGYLPAGLIEEIKALSMPPIPWDVELANWFDCYFAPLARHRSYARPSRRQNATPEIPRPRYVYEDIAVDSRTFGVVIDTSGSMTNKQLGMALGSIASYASAKDVPMARVVFCDAQAYDAGYLSPDDIAGRVEVKGRGGTILQPGIDLLQNAKDFPKNGPILIITDGYIEENLIVKHDHAYLLPKGNRLPFRARGNVFYFDES